MDGIKKLYCYVDETGQDTHGEFFLVAVVIVGSNREEVRALLRRIEHASGKGIKKWTKATRKQRQAYMESVIQIAEFREKLFYAHFEGTTDYLPCVLHTVAQAVTTVAADQSYRVTVLIDGLGKSERHKVGAGLRQLKVKVKKVRGLRDESDAFIRLADATAGFVRDYLEGQAYVKQLYQKAVARGVMQEV